jgi:hypothetical protein
MKALIQYWDKTQHDLAREALRKVGRRDLIGRGPGCLVPAEWQSSVPLAPDGKPPRGSRPGPRPSGKKRPRARPTKA